MSIVRLCVCIWYWTNNWNFVTAGSVRDANSLEDIFIELNSVGFNGTVSVKWEDNDAGANRGFWLVPVLWELPHSGMRHETYY